MHRMVRLLSAGLVCGVLTLLVGCGADAKLTSNNELTGGLWTVSLKSSAFKHKEAIPEQYTQYGTNTSPPLNWSAGPSGVKEWILVVEDADQRVDEQGRPAVNWAVFKIPANVTSLPEGAARSITFPQGKNYLGEAGYAGPKPPAGKEHRYFFQIFAVDTPQDFPPGADRDTVRKNFKGFVLSKGILVGTFKGPEK